MVAAPSKPPVAESEPGDQPVRVLIVEDDEDDYILTQSLLQEIPGRCCRIDWAPSFESAFEALAKEAHDVYLVDFRLGGRDGLELLQHPALRDRAVIMLTGLDDPEVDANAMSAGAADYLVKDRIDAAMLERSIRYAIQQKRSEASLRRARDELEQRVRERTQELVGLNAQLRDQIAHQQRTERALRHSEERFRLLVEGVRDYAIFMCDPEGRITSWNEGAERINGYAADEIMGRQISIFHPPEEVEQKKYQMLLDEARVKGSIECEGWRLRKGGTRYWASIVMTAIRDETGGLLGFSKIVCDLTDRRRAEEALRCADQRKDEFLAMLAHELRNPLSAISNSIQLMRMPQVSLEHLEWCRAVIERHVQHLSRMVGDLLDVSRITRGKIELRKELLEASPIINSAIDTVRPHIEEKKQMLSVSLVPGTLWCDADPTRLEQILSNLLHNATRYSPRGGHIWLTASVEGEYLLFQIKDDGTGMRPEELTNVFELFAQGDRGIARSEGGLGIGLTVVKHLTELHGGSVSALSEGPGKGSEFIVRLPSAPAPPIITDQAIPSAGEPARRRRILVVDDNVDAAVGLGRLLEQLGHSIRTAHDGLSALEMARRERPELVLLDIGLPGIDGYEVARRLRGDAECGRPQLVALTGYGQENDRRRSMEAGFDLHLVKPVLLSELVALLAPDPNDLLSA